MDDLRSLMTLSSSEVLLFTPVFSSYRFAGDTKLKLNHKTRHFVESFTMKGIADYNGVNEYMLSIKEKLKTELHLDFVRPILLDAGSCKNALFFLTKSQKGMLEMNKAVLRESSDAYDVSVRQVDQQTLFEPQVVGDLKSQLISELRRRKKMTNREIIKWTIIEGFLPKHAKEVLITLHDMKSITVSDEFGKVILPRQWSIAEAAKEITIFHFLK